MDKSQAVAGLADDLRAAGYRVFGHRDGYISSGVYGTHWLVTDGNGISYSAEGASDAEALNQIRAKAGLPVLQPAAAVSAQEANAGTLLFEPETVAMLVRLKERLYDDRPLTGDQRRDLANTLDAIMHRAVPLG